MFTKSIIVPTSERKSRGTASKTFITCAAPMDIPYLAKCCLRPEAEPETLQHDKPDIIYLQCSKKFGFAVPCQKIIR